MAETYTSNLRLTKPDYDSPADISVINSNMDKIDNAVANAGGVKSVNGKTPDGSGAVTIEASDIGYGDNDVGSSLGQLKNDMNAIPEWAKQPNKPSYNSSEITYGNTNVESAINGLSDDKLGKTATAADSAKLGGVAASEYATHTDVSTAITDALNAIQNASGVRF